MHSSLIDFGNNSILVTQHTSIKGVLISFSSNSDNNKLVSLPISRIWMERTISTYVELKWRFLSRSKACLKARGRKNSFDDLSIAWASLWGYSGRNFKSIVAKAN